jgi:hypothetical protein
VEGGLRGQGLRVGSGDLFYACKGWVIAELFGYRGLPAWLIRFWLMVFGSAWVAMAGMIDGVASIGWAFIDLVSLFCTKYLCNISALQVQSVSEMNLSISRLLVSFFLYIVRHWKCPQCLVSFLPCHYSTLEVSTAPLPDL